MARKAEKAILFWVARNKFLIENDLLLHGSRMVIPELLQQEVAIGTVT